MISKITLGFACSYTRICGQLFLKSSCSTAHVIQKDPRPNLHGGVSEGIPEAFPGPPDHAIVKPALVLPFTVEFPIQICSMTSGKDKGLIYNVKSAVIFKRGRYLSIFLI